MLWSMLPAPIGPVPCVLLRRGVQQVPDIDAALVLVGQYELGVVGLPLAFQSLHSGLRAGLTPMPSVRRAYASKALSATIVPTTVWTASAETHTWG